MAKKISFQKVLNVDSKKALEVITNFNDYSNFIPGCTRATLISREPPIEIGRLEFNVLGKDYYIESENTLDDSCLLYTSPSPRDYAASRMPSSA